MSFRQAIIKILASSIVIAIPAISMNVYGRHEYFKRNISTQLKVITKDVSVSFSYKDAPGFSFFDGYNVAMAVKSFPNTNISSYNHNYKSSELNNSPSTQIVFTVKDGTILHEMEVHPRDSTINISHPL